MSLIQNFYRLSLVLALCLLLAVSAFADTIRLKDGSQIKGKIISFANGQFVILIGSGDRQRQMHFFADEIESIEFDSTPANTMTNPSVSQNDSRPSYSTETDGNTTIITVGSSTKTPNPQSNPPVTKTPDPIPVSTPQPIPVSTPATTAASKPIQVKVKVLADNTANGWTNAGWVVRKGQKIRISGAGRISLGNGRFSGPGGIATLPDDNKLIADRPTGGLIAVIGDDNNDFVFVGDTMEFVAERDGALFLGVNEGMLDDNSGAFDVVIEIDPSITE
ncbi:MAG: LecA/PA-IL family lectin [Pyrinomonadaceae bacterium]